MTVLLFIGISAVIGCILYLPFFLWFRYRRPRQGPYAVKLNYTPAGWALLVAEVAALFVGFALIDPASGVRRGVFAPGGLGLLQWLICVVIAVHVIGMLLRGANIPLQRPAPAPGDAASTGQVAAAVAPSPGYRVMTIRGVPVFAHRSYLFGGVFIGVAVGPHLAGIVGCCIAYAALLAIHEVAHAATGRLLGLRVQAIELSGIGGLCRMSVPRRMRDAWLVYSAGLASQLLLATLTVVAIDGEPQTPFAKAVVITFTWVNAMLFLVNLIPGRTHHGHRTDGGCPVGPGAASLARRAASARRPDGGIAGASSGDEPAGRRAPGAGGIPYRHRDVQRRHDNYGVRGRRAGTPRRTPSRARHRRDAAHPPAWRRAPAAAESRGGAGRC